MATDKNPTAAGEAASSYGAPQAECGYGALGGSSAP